MTSQSEHLAGGWRAWLLSGSPASRRQARLGRLYIAWLGFRGNHLAMLGLGIVLALILVAIFAPLIAPYNPNAQVLADRLQFFSAQHWFGTDDLGRDIFSRIVYGSRLTLYIVVLVAIIAAPIGLLVGTTAGYFGGWLDMVLMRITDIFLAFPKLVLALALVAALGPGIENAIIAIAITSWPPYARIARAETITIRNSDFIAAVRLQGAGLLRLMFITVLPNCMAPLIVQATLGFSTAILDAAALGFLGLGAQPPLPEWGAMISAGRKVLLDQWWVATVPGIAIFVVSLGFNLLGDGLRDVLDPKSGGQG